jgi:hypothetical protein
MLLAIAFLFGSLTKSQTPLWALVTFAVVAWVIARSKP